MSRETTALLSVAVLGSITAVFALAAFDWAAWTCRLPHSEPSKPFALGAGGCIDFWVYRYQTLVGGGIAVIAAGVAWAAASRQVEQMKKQNKLVLQQTAVQKSAEVQKGLVIIRRFNRLLEEIELQNSDAGFAMTQLRIALGIDYNGFNPDRINKNDEIIKKRLANCKNTSEIYKNFKNEYINLSDELIRVGIDTGTYEDNLNMRRWLKIPTQFYITAQAFYEELPDNVYGARVPNLIRYCMIDPNETYALRMAATQSEHVLKKIAIEVSNDLFGTGPTEH